MPQTYNQFFAPLSFLASNVDLSITTETIILDQVSIAGYINFGLAITNRFGSADTITSVNVYGSCDGVNYFTISSGLLTSIGTNSTSYHTFNATAMFLRITAVSNSSSTLDCYLVGLVNK